MKILNKTFNYQTKGEYDFIDITNEVKDFVDNSGIKNGLVNIQILHTSAALMVNENEPLLIEDIKDNLEECSPKSKEYRHDNLSMRTVNVCDSECMNGHSHCKAIHLLMNATINLIDNKLQLGQWQNIMLVELDSSRPRNIQVQIIGE
ncbi:MAG: secondary thiamine-phosphate synthase enzyme YjbQ [Candidatus Nealsonbacteria bacterium]|nr:secondary thiamine-phosphate synthase enzyme YjbQ [Candidatus Nealsonbacteria bacterium]